MLAASAATVHPAFAEAQAKALGLAIPPAILIRADEVILDR